MNTRKTYIDVLAVLSCFGVVALHCNGVFWSRPHGFTWITANLIESLFYFSAPVFFMISGATLTTYRKRYDTKTLLVQRFRRIFIPFLFWTLVAYLGSVVTGGFSFKNVLRLPIDIVTCRYMPIYWFFIPIFIWYLTVPLYSLLVGRKKTLEYLIIIGLIFTSCYPFVCTLVGSKPISSLTIPAVCGCTIFMLIGHYLESYELPSWVRKSIYVCGVIGLLVHFIGTDMCSGGAVSRMFNGYTTPLCVAYTSAIFLFVKNSKFWNRPRKWIDFLRKETFGIYLLHGFFIYKIIPHFMSAEVRGTLVFRLFGTIAIFVLCALLSNFLHRVKLTTWMV